MATAARWEDNDEWELVNDDGFVYKRKKRPCPEPTISASSSAPPPPDPALEESNRSERKKSALLKLKERYQQEIHQWELLSNTLSDMLKKTPITREQVPQDHSTTVSPVLPAESAVSSCRTLVDELLSQADAQEAIIQDVSNLCDIVEALCSAKEDRFKQSFTELPIWASPQEIISSLCDD